ncbi:MAG: protein translocase subunit SecD [Armatimonadetes bacterium]|nr:protein translocase subunit SecD [Armatimonadota bacterium]
MQSRGKWWIITIIALFVLSFLYAFQPIRFIPKQGFDVQSTFRYTFPEPLAEGPAALTEKANEIRQYLTTKGLQLDRVEFVEANVLEIETLALEQKQADADAAKLMTELSAKYPGVKALPLPDDAQVEQPLYRLGSAIGIYRPSLKVKLGLDLQGGAHVVLRCLPETRFVFTSPEDKPLSQKPPTPGTKPVETTPDGKKIVPTNVTPEALTDSLKNVLVRGGVPADEVKVDIPADNMAVVETRAANQDAADKQQKLLQAYLERSYPGVEITTKAESVFLEADTAEKVKNIIDRRLYFMSDIREPLIQKQGTDQIIVELPGVKDPDRVVSILKSTAMLEFRLIPQRYEPIGAAEDDYSEWRDSQTQQTVPWERVLAESEAMFTGRDLMSNAAVNTDSAGTGWVVSFELRAERKNAFRDFTRRNVGRLMAIVLDGKCQMAPVIKSEIPGEGVIEGNFTAQEARDLKLLLNAGALPVPLEIAENRTISATLGTYAIHRSIQAGIYGLLAVVLFMIAWYRLPGLLADVALALYVFIVLAVLVFTKTTLTLPGIAGIILSIGMAVDANILIFERLREEVWSGKSMRAAIEAGFERAWTAILDSNVNSLIVAAVLYFLGTSSIKSFAVTLFVGVACSLFTAVTVSRWMVTMVGNSRLSQNYILFGVRAED